MPTPADDTDSPQADLLDALLQLGADGDHEAAARLAEQMGRDDAPAPDAVSTERP